MVPPDDNEYLFLLYID